MLYRKYYRHYKNVLNVIESIIAKVFNDNLKDRNFCPVCESYPENFLPLPPIYQENARKYGYTHFGKGEMTSGSTYSCPHCGASDRERLYALYLKEQYEQGFIANQIKMIHFAPEPALSNMFRQWGVFDYKTADLNMSSVDYTVDLCNMREFENARFDCFICSHVLEHVNNDNAAIQELYRILKQGGWGILMAPIHVDLDHTLEDPNIITNEERWKYFGQNDHVRLYAKRDYIDRVKQHGFSLNELDKRYFGSKIFERLGLKPTSVLYIVEKP
jgi:hypothetical protein